LRAAADWAGDGTAAVSSKKLPKWVTFLFLVVLSVHVPIVRESAGTGERVSAQTFSGRSAHVRAKGKNRSWCMTSQAEPLSEIEAVKN
jgi:hypothetical protein